VQAATRHRAYDIIRNEHRAIAAVIHCFEQILKEVRDQELDPPFDLFSLVIRYLAEFPDQFHHPKEDDYLFPAVSRRDPAAGEVIQELQEQHEDCVRKTATLARLLAAWKAGEEGSAEAFDQAARSYIAFQWEHIRLEETEILPAAREALSEQDWRTIDEAFGENDDPIFGANPQEAFNGLFRKIVATAPAPWGLGVRHEPKRSSTLSKIGIGRK
jgi:branched-chain amino acid transport system ATP-binding protein